MHRSPPSDSLVGLVLLGLSVIALALWHTGRRLSRTLYVG